MTKISAEDGKLSAKISRLTEAEGDCDVSQRKGKVITLFDLVVKLEWEGKTEDGETADGSITIPEVAHDTAEDEYVFEIDTHSPTAAKDKVKDLVRSNILPQLRAALQELAPALIAEHGKDIQHTTSEPPVTPKPAALPTPIAVSSKPSSSTAGRVNTTTLTSNEEFRTSAEQLQRVFTDPGMIAAFTRGKPKVWSGTNPGDKFVIFDGNVEGSFVSMSPTEIVQKWRLRQWPEGHFSTLTMKFDQNDREGVTVLRMTWDGVPIGQEDVTKRNWDEYYVKSIKICFGYGTVL